MVQVRVKGAVEVPLFVPDTGLDPGSLLKQMSAFGMGGWWLGGTHMKTNESFLADVQAKVRAMSSGMELFRTASRICRAS